MEDNKQLKPFIIGLAISIFFIFTFFIGALADRIFVIRPLDFIFKREQFLTAERQLKEYPQTSLGEMMQQGGYSIADVAEKASESVITVSIKKQQQVIEPGSIFDPFGFFGIQQQEIRLEEVQRDIGSGFVVEGGLIVTNKHVVADVSAEYLIIDKDDQELEVTEIYRDPSLDMAILQVKDFRAPALALGDSDQVRVGEPVIAIGTALGQFRHTVTTGVISGIGRSITAAGGGQFESLQNMLQTDAAINPGNSGGPLINNRGEVIGVNVATTAADNISFAIPINVVKAAITNFNETGQFDRPMLGVRYTMISEQAALVNEIPRGAYLLEVVPGSSADQAGLKAGDIIVEFDGNKLSEEQELAQLINQKRVGASVRLRIYKDNSFQTINITLRSQK
jgi:S1-C subfamily serine protease